MRVDLFDFELPAERIAHKPATPNDSAKLLRIGSSLEDFCINDLPNLLSPGDVIVVNDTKVLPCRLRGRCINYITPNSLIYGANMEVTLHKQMMSNAWLAFARPARKLSIGSTITFTPKFNAIVTQRLSSGEVLLTFNISGTDLVAAIEKNGAMPLPPYIKRDQKGDPKDFENYQTIFADEPGAVAAPTAGLHFTSSLVQALHERGITLASITLHVGAGTFLPVKVDDTENHLMHGEWGELSQATADTVNDAHKNGHHVLSVGSTSLRMLESAANDSGILRPYYGETKLFITQGYHFKVVDLLLTNFHLPRSTLFMLVCAFSGLERMQAAYKHAIHSGYRFYSYGDACLLEPNWKAEKV